MILFPYLDLGLLRRYKGDRSWSEYYINDLRNITDSVVHVYTVEVDRMDHVVIAVHKNPTLMTTALTLSSYNGNLELVKYLVENGADVTAESNVSVKMAKINKHTEIINYLVSCGATDPR